MLNKLQHMILTSVAGMVFVLVIISVILVVTNRSLQGDIAARQQFIQQSMQLEGLYKQMVSALAELAAKNDDAQLKALLNAQGITFSVNAPSGAGGTSARRK